MSSKLLGVVVVAAAGAAAAGLGAFLAFREAPTVPSAQAAAVRSGTADGGVQAIDETEVRVAPAATPPAANPAPRAEKTTAGPRAASVQTARPERRAPVAAAPRTNRVAVQPASPAAGPAVADAGSTQTIETSPLPSTPAPTVAPLPLPAPLPPEPQFEELIIPADAVVGLQLETSVSSDTARVEDRVEARVTRDVRVAGRVAIPAGSRVEGAVTFVEPGGKFKEQARLGVRFHTVVLGDGSSVPLPTETVYREGTAPGNKSAAKIGGAAVGGAVLGAILGGGKGAAIGGSIGAAGGTAAVMAGDRSPAKLPAGTTVTVRLSGPATVTVER